MCKAWIGASEKPGVSLRFFGSTQRERETERKRRDGLAGWLAGGGVGGGSGAVFFFFIKKFLAVATIVYGGASIVGTPRY